MSDESQANHITTKFNVALFVFSAVMGILIFLFSDKVKNVPLEGVVLSILVDSVRYVVMLLIVAFFIKEFWRRLISNLFPVRAIGYAEAIAIVLMSSILFSR